jgi:hypothetical protein
VTDEMRCVHCKHPTHEHATLYCTPGSCRLCKPTADNPRSRTHVADCDFFQNRGDCTCPPYKRGQPTADAGEIDVLLEDRNAAVAALRRGITVRLQEEVALAIATAREQGEAKVQHFLYLGAQCPKHGDWTGETGSIVCGGCYTDRYAEGLERAAEIAPSFMDPCRCSAAYKDRGLEDPDCSTHAWEQFIEAIRAEARKT